MNGIGIHTAETRSLDSVPTKKATVEQKETVKKVATPTEANPQIKAKNADENTFVFPFSLIPDSSLSQKEIASLAAKMSGTDKGNADRSFDSFPNSFIAILLQAMETFMSSMTNINQIMQDSFKQTIAALGAARQMTDTSLEMADVTYRHSNKAAALHLAASFGTLITGAMGVAQLGMSIKSPLNRTQDLNNAGEKFGLKPEMQDVSQRLNANKAKVEDWGNKVTADLGAQFKSEITTAEQTGQTLKAAHKGTLSQLEAEVQVSPNSTGKKAIQDIEKKAEKFKTDHKSDIDTVHELTRDSIKDVKIEAQLGANHAYETDLINSGIVHKDNNGNFVLKNTLGKTSTTDANGVTTEKIFKVVKTRDQDTIKIHVFETKTNSQNIDIDQKYSLINKVDITGKTAEYSRLSKVSHHEKLDDFKALNDSIQNWDANKAGVNDRKSKIIPPGQKLPDLPTQSLPENFASKSKEAFERALKTEVGAIAAHERIKPTQDLYSAAGTEFQKIGQHVGRHEAKQRRILDSMTVGANTIAPMFNQIYASSMSMEQQQAEAAANLERGRADALRGQNDAMLKTMEQLASTWLDTSNRLLSAVLDAITNALQAAIRSVETR